MGGYVSVSDTPLRLRTFCVTAPPLSPALYEEIRQFRDACGDAHMKTILAVGELGTFTNVYRASLTAMMAGEDT